MPRLLSPLVAGGGGGIPRPLPAEVGVGAEVVVATGVAVAAGGSVLLGAGGERSTGIIRVYNYTCINTLL